MDSNTTPATYSIRSAIQTIQISIPNRTLTPLKTGPMPSGEEATNAFWNKKLAELEEDQ